MHEKTNNSPTDDAVDVITNVLLKEFDDCSDTVVGDTVHLSFGALAIVKPTSTGWVGVLVVTMVIVLVSVEDAVP